MKNYFMGIILLLSLFGNRLWGQELPVVSIFYYSKTGNTKAMAESAKRGAESVDSVTVHLYSVEEAKSEHLLEADAIIVGSPVYKANIAPSVIQFINTWPFEGTPLKDKVGAAFVTAGGISAGEELVQMNILQAMLLHGMIIVGGPDWKGAFGASAITSEKPFNLDSTDGQVQEQFLKKAASLGKRVALLAKRLKI